MADAVARHPELELVTQDLSITTFRYVPADLRRADSGARRGPSPRHRSTARCSTGCSAAASSFVSNAVIGGRYLLRACIVNFHTEQADVEAVPAIVARVGRAMDEEVGRAALGS